MRQIFNFKNVQLVPNKCKVYSRSECDTSVQLGTNSFKLPVIPANMVTVVNQELCWQLAAKGYFYVMHRFNIDNLNFIRETNKRKLITSISIGVKDYDYALIKKIASENLKVDYITIDIAHGHSNRVRDMIYHIRTFLKNVFIISGNIATVDAAKDLEEWGSDALKVGVGPGKACTTRYQTGFGTAGYQLAALYEISQAVNIPLILDGGIRYPGDIAKAIRFGALMAMIGYMFAGHEESPGKTVSKNGNVFKQYYGSASVFNKNTQTHIEGTMFLIPKKGSIWETINGLHEGLQSAISYAGGTKLKDLTKVEYVIVQ